MTPMMPANNYLASLKRVVLSKSSSSGALQFVAVFTLTHAANNGAWSPIESADRNVYWSMSGGAKDYTKKKLQALGIGVDGPPETVTDGDEEVVVLPQAVNEDPIELLCKHETYNNAQRERWELANWGGGGTGQAASKEDAAQLRSMWS